MALPVPGPLTRSVAPTMGFGQHPTKETFVLFRLVALALVLTGPAAAQDYNQPDIVRGLCQKDGCDDFRVLSAEPVTSTDAGRLLRTRIQTFHASRAGRQERAQENGFVFCSPARPIMAGAERADHGLLPGPVCDRREPGERAPERQLPCPLFCDLPRPGGRK